MWPPLVMIPDGLADQAPQPGLAQDQDVIQAFSADAAVEALDEGVHQGRLVGSEDEVDIAGLGHALEFVTELAIVIEDQVVGLDVPGRGLAKLLRRPGVRWIPGDAEVDDPSRVDVHDEEREDGSKEEVVGLYEIARPNLRGVVVEELVPILTRVRSAAISELFDDALDSAFADPDSQFEELTTEPFGSPKEILDGDAANEGLGPWRQSSRLGAWTRFASPVEFEQPPVPADHRGRLDDVQGVPPVGQQAGQQDREQAVFRCELWPARLPVEDGELMAQQGVFSNELSLAAPEVQEGADGEPGARAHRSRPQAHSARERSTEGLAPVNGKRPGQRGCGAVGGLRRQKREQKSKHGPVFLPRLDRPIGPCDNSAMGTHDKLFKAVFSEPANAVAHFESFLPAEITAALDLGRAQHVPGSFVDEALSERHTDLLYSVPWRQESGDADHEVLLYVLFEHGRGPEVLKQLPRWEDEFRIEVARGKPGLQNLTLLVTYLMTVNEHVTVDALAEFLEPMGDAAKEIPMSIVQQQREEGRQEGRQEGEAKGRQDALLQTARKALAKGMSPADVAELTDLPLEEIQKLAH